MKQKIVIPVVVSCLDLPLNESVFLFAAQLKKYLLKNSYYKSLSSYLKLHYDTPLIDIIDSLDYMQYCVLCKIIGFIFSFGCNSKIRKRI